MPSWKAWLMRPSGIIKRGRKRIALLREITFIKVDNVLLDQISIVNLHQYWVFKCILYENTTIAIHLYSLWCKLI
jgi:hypothetical protein